MEYLQHSPLLNDPQLTPHARLATAGAPTTPQWGGRLAELPAAAAASWASSPAVTLTRARARTLTRTLTLALPLTLTLMRTRTLTQP
jgi:hypothetical protein